MSDSEVHIPDEALLEPPQIYHIPLDSSLVPDPQNPWQPRREGSRVFVEGEFGEYLRTGRWRRRL